jgi:hypothetical protein
MSDRLNNHREGHPSLEVLVLHVSGELSGKEAETVSAHVNECWLCMAECEGLRRGIHAFVDYRADAFENIPSPPRSILRLRELLEEVDRQQQGRFLRSFGWIAISETFRWPAWIGAAMASLAGVILFLLPVTEPPRLTASEFLQHLGSSLGKQSLSKREYVVQKIRIRRGKRTIDREIVRGLTQTNLAGRGFAPEWQSAFTGPLSANDPLDPVRFISWHRDLRSRQDELSETSSHVTMTTRCTADKNVRMASLTVRRADWHPIAERVTLRDGDTIEVVELSFDIRTASDQQFSREFSGTRTPDQTRAAAFPQMLRRFSPLELEEIEIEVRRKLFAAEVGFEGHEAEMQISSSPAGIRVQTVVPSEARREQVRTVLDEIKGVTTQIRTEAEIALSALPRNSLIHAATAVPDAPRREPLLRQEMTERLGSGSLAQQYINRIFENSNRTRCLIVQLKRLTERYPETEEARLPIPVRNKLISLSGTMLQSIGNSLDKESALLMPFLESQPGLQASTLINSSGSDFTWQARARRLFGCLSQKHQLLASLFAVTAGDQTVADSVQNSTEQLGRLVNSMHAWSADL